MLSEKIIGIIISLSIIAMTGSRVETVTKVNKEVEGGVEISLESEIEKELNNINTNEEEFQIQNVEEIEVAEPEEVVEPAQEEVAEVEQQRIVDINSYNILEVSNIKSEELWYLLADTKLVDCAWGIAEAEKIYGINALALTGIVALESGWGTSSRAINDNNLTGYAVYNDSSIGRRFKDKNECVLETARLLKEDYLSADGKYYNGLSLYDVNKRYCTSSDWASKVSKIANDLLREYNERF